MKKDRSIFYFDAYHEVRDTKGNLVFVTETIDNDNVIDNVVILWNKNNGENCFGPDGVVDKYLLDEGECSQEEREFIIEELNEYFYK